MTTEEEKKYRTYNYVFTLNNPELHPAQRERLLDESKWPEYVRCVMYGVEHSTDEEIEQGLTPHYQGFIVLWEKKTHKQLSVWWLKDIWFKPMYGPLTASERYCSKETSLIVIGDKPQQGRRTDIICVKRKIDADPTKMIWDIAEQNETDAKVVFKNYRALGEYANYKLRKLHKTMKHRPKVYIFYGPSHTGKSEWLEKLVGVENVDTLPPPTSTWWIDDYCARTKYLRVDEITPERAPPLDFFLNITDKICKPYNIKGGSMTMRPEIIVFTSNIHPFMWYKDGMSDEHWQAFCERMTGGIYKTQKGKEPHLEFKWGEKFIRNAQIYTDEYNDWLTELYACGTKHAAPQGPPSM